MRRIHRRWSWAGLGLSAVAAAADTPPLPTLRVAPPKPLVVDLRPAAPAPVKADALPPGPRANPATPPTYAIEAPQLPALELPALRPRHLAAKPAARAEEPAVAIPPASPAMPAPREPLPVPQPLVPAAPQPKPGVEAAPMRVVDATPATPPRDVPRVDAIAPRVELSQTAPQEAKHTDHIPVELVVANRGADAVEKLIVTVELPEGAEFQGGTPHPARNRDTLIWSLGQLAGGQQRVLRYKVSIKAGADLAEFAPIATARYDAALATPVRLVRPRLLVEVESPSEAVVNGRVLLNIKIANRGTAPAANVLLRAPLPPELKHPYGPELENDLGEIEPGGVRTVALPLTAVRAGPVVARMTVSADGAAPQVKEVAIDVKKIDFAVQASAARTRVLNRPVEYQFVMSNDGNAPTSEARIVATLPRGVAFVHAGDPGVYDAALHQVTWTLGRLPPGERKLVTLTGVANELGTQVCRAVASANGIERVSECQTVVQGVAALQVGLLETVDPLDVGGVTVYEIMLTNQGTAAQSNIVLRCQMPPELEALDTQGPTKPEKLGAELVFAAVASMDPKAKLIFKIKARAKKAGDARVRVEATSDQHRRPILKEEATRVFGDDGP